jgi:hypothetical protein
VEVVDVVLVVVVVVLVVVLVVVVGATVVGAEVVGGGVAPPSSWSASRYAPYPDAVDHSSADSTLVPSPHSLNVVTNWNRAPDATMSRTFCRHRATSRTNRTA